MADTDPSTSNPGPSVHADLIAEPDELERLTSASRWRRWMFLGAAAAVVGLAGWGGYRQWFAEDAAPVAPVATATVTRGSLARTLQTSGSVESGKSVQLSFSTAGTVAEVRGRVGQQVAEGDIIARLDDTDLKRRVETASASLRQAQIRFAQLSDPATADTLASARQTVVQAENQLASARLALETLLGPHTAEEILAAQQSLATAENQLAQAEANVAGSDGTVANALVNLRAAQDEYCDWWENLQSVCLPESLPLIPSQMELVSSAFARPNNFSSVRVNAAKGLVSANVSYLNALASRDSLKASVGASRIQRDLAQVRAKALSEPPTASALQQARAAVTNAEASLATAQARETTVKGGATANELELQRIAVQLSQISYQDAVTALDQSVLKAPFAGSLGVVSATVGARVNAGTAIATLADPGAVRVDLTVSESDVGGLKAGMLGFATVDAMSGQSYPVRVIGVSPVPVVTQGVVTYPVQAEILKGDQLVALRDQIATTQRALSSAGGRTAAVGQAAGATATASGTPGAASPTGTPGGAASGTPGARPTGAGGTGGQGQRPGGGTGTPPAGATGAAGTVGAGAAALNLPSAGMTATVTVLIEVQENVLLVPASAVRRQGRQSVVFVPTDNGGSEAKPVTTGGTDGTRTIITSGLDEGAVIVTSPGAATATPTGSATRTTGGTQPQGGVQPQGGPGGGGGTGGIR